MNDASGDCIEQHVGADGGNGVASGAARDSQDARTARAMHKTQAHIDPTRWWFGAAFPMMAGTLGPVASAFSICALVRPWRQHLPPGTEISKAEFVHDPTWLIAVNAVQLGVAIVANLFLLLNMARRIRFTIAMPVTIVGWYLSSICLVALAATAVGPLVIEPAEEYIWSQAFFYGIFAAIIYFIVASLLVVTAYGAYIDRYDSDFQLTASQRTLMLQTIIFLMYLLLGAFVFSTIEGWAYLDAVYWADVTLFTVGFGDIGATTRLGRALLFPYALIGIISLGLVIGSIRSLVLERGRKVINARVIEKKRRHTVRRLTTKGKANLLVPVRTEDQTDRDSEQPTEIARREKEFRLMRTIQAQAATRRRWVAMALSSTTWVVLWLAGAGIFQACEAPYQGWSYFDAVYFAFVSLTTIGYGDVTPISNPGRAFFVVWSLLALPTTTVLISNAGDTVVKSIRDLTDLVGGITILPREKAVLGDAKAILRTISFGKLVLGDDEKTEELPPGFLGQARLRRSSNESNTSESDNEPDEGPRSKRKDALDDEEETGAQSSKPPADSKRRDSTEKEPTTQEAALGFPTAIPENRAEYHVVLASTIARVSQHMKQKPARKYSFVEWAWYLRLMGEDESSPETHRQAEPHAHRHHYLSHLGRDGASEKPDSWSWVGTRSPLMGRQDEAEWIHEKLLAKLTDELRAVRDEERSLPRGQNS